MADEETPLLNNKDESPPKKTRRFPDAFYDVKTGKLLQDPVVAPGGITYERSTWEEICETEEVPSAPAYDNRALKQLIEEALLESPPPAGGGRPSAPAMLLKMHHNTQKSMRDLIEKSILPSDDPKPLSDAYYCPITMSLMQHPVIGPEGYTFEKEAIEHWVDENQVSPLTRTPLPSKELLYPNLALQQLLQEEADKADETNSDPSIRDFKLLLLESNTTQQQEEAPYTGPRTMEEWQTLRDQRRRSNANVTPRGFMVLFLVILLLIPYFIVYFLLFSWFGYTFFFLCCIVDHYHEGSCYGYYVQRGMQRAMLWYYLREIEREYEEQQEEEDAPAAACSV
ncbi:SAM and U-box domain-containing protein 1 [Seminavis robusta]|uniref:SAM and U-box domain-containing protein 1 n=1 Tax=Seminavis robusta TaxID=568900 RepID=A0A9N8HJB7_9STRA|nr:SAM and U-box domain-containing protein 1 [Seminavis robusta]|eukprot:Sro650_g181460.1 SAM and U-box domain-containing protein 1 (340) ;mRNA; f:47604-48623